MSGHTPGPWELRPSHLTTGFDVLAPADAGGARDIVASYVRASDAPLIAEAPRLLADLTAAAKVLRHYEKLQRSKGAADSLAKAQVNADFATSFEATIAAAGGQS